jgi:hypothetical protein
MLRTTQPRSFDRSVPPTHPTQPDLFQAKCFLFLLRHVLKRLPFSSACPIATERGSQVVSASPKRHDTRKAAEEDALGLHTAKKSQFRLRHIKSDFARI